MPTCGINGRRAGVQRLRGFSMVELMIALVVGLFLLGGIIQLLISSRLSYQVGEQVSRIQENGRYVVNLFAERARRSLSLGCRNAMMEIPLDGVSVSGDALIVNSCLLREDTSDSACLDSLIDNKSVVRTDAALGYDASEQGTATWLKDMPDGSGNPVAARWLRGDVLVVWGTEGAGTGVSAFTAVTNDEGESEITSMTLAEENKELGAGAEAAMITNCEQSHLFDIESSTGAALTVDAGSGETLSGNYDIPSYDSVVALESMNPLNKAHVYPFIYEAYFVCCTDTESGSLVSSEPQSSCDGTSDRYRPSLCKWRSGSDTQTLVNEISDLRVTYSGDTDDDGVVDFRASDRDTAHTAAWVTEQGHWSKVIGTQIELLVTSDSPARFGDTEEEAPIDLRWPPNDPDSPPESPDEDTLGYALRTLTTNRRLFERYVISAAFRARAPWFIEP